MTMSKLLAVVCALFALVVVTSAQITTGACVSSLDQLSVAQAASIQGCLTQSFLPTGEQCVERCIAFAIDQTGPSSFCAPGTTSPAQICQTACEEFVSECGVSMDCTGFSNDATLCIDIPKSSVSAVISGLTAESDSDSEDEDFSGSAEEDSDDSEESEEDSERPHGRRPHPPKPESESDEDETSDSDSEEESKPPRRGPHGRPRPPKPESESDEDEEDSEEESKPPRRRGPHRGPNRRPRSSSNEGESDEEEETEVVRGPNKGRRPRPPQPESNEQDSESEPVVGRPNNGRPNNGRPNNGRPNNGRPNNGRPNSGRPGKGRPNKDVEVIEQPAEQEAPSKHRFFDKFRHNAATSNIASIALVGILAMFALAF